jgi:Tfp pilus assembly protein PilN
VATVAANAVPEGVWLTGMSLDRGKPLQIRGSAKTNEQVADYVQQLSSSERLRDVKLVFSNNNTIGDTPIVQFSISAHVIGNYPLADTEQKRGSRR